MPTQPMTGPASLLAALERGHFPSFSLLRFLTLMFLAQAFRSFPAPCDRNSHPPPCCDHQKAERAKIDFEKPRPMQRAVSDEAVGRRSAGLSASGVDRSGEWVFRCDQRRGLCRQCFLETDRSDRKGIFTVLEGV